jgi:hypothetical protein
MDATPEWVEPDEIAELVEKRAEQREEALTSRGECLLALDSGNIERAERAKREYQLAAYETRQAEGEILWGIVGHAITDLVSRGVEPEDQAVRDRGTTFIDWAVGSDTLASVHSAERVHLIVARRFPTAPEAHEPYLMAMLDTSLRDISERRERDREMLDAAGWLRRGRTGAADRALLSCPHCGNRLPVQVPDGGSPRVSTSFAGEEGEMREICPHCERDIFVAAAGDDAGP